jgi:hypothetical protein
MGEDIAAPALVPVPAVASAHRVEPIPFISLCRAHFTVSFFFLLSIPPKLSQWIMASRDRKLKLFF